MKFNFFKKNKEDEKVIVKTNKAEAMVFVKEQFTQLTKRHLSIPVTLYQL